MKNGDRGKKWNKTDLKGAFSTYAENFGQKVGVAVLAYYKEYRVSMPQH